MSDTEIMAGRSDFSVNEAQFLLEFSDRVECVEFVYRPDQCEARHIYRLAPKVEGLTDE
jgi:hypothetical protein